MPYEMHPAGDFRAQILDHGFSESTTGTPQFTTVFETEHGRITGFFALTDKAAEHTLKKIRAMGYEGDDLSDLEDGDVLRGCYCTIQVVHEPYNGRTTAKVGFVNPDGWEPGIKKSAAAAAVARRFNSLLKKTTNGNGKTDDKPPF